MNRNARKVLTISASILTISLFVCTGARMLNLCQAVSSESRNSR